MKKYPTSIAFRVLQNRPLLLCPAAPPLKHIIGTRISFMSAAFRITFAQVYMGPFSKLKSTSCGLLAAARLFLWCVGVGKRGSAESQWLGPLAALSFWWGSCGHSIGPFTLKCGDRKGGGLRPVRDWKAYLTKDQREEVHCGALTPLCFRQPWCLVHRTKALSTLLWPLRSFPLLSFLHFFHTECLSAPLKWLLKETLKVQMSIKVAVYLKMNIIYTPACPYKPVCPFLVQLKILKNIYASLNVKWHEQWENSLNNAIFQVFWSYMMMCEDIFH